jgi:hypothetical protein
MLIDCDTCVARGLACADCVVTVLLHNPPQPVDLDDDEQAAIEQLADAGLVPPLRLVPQLPVEPAGPAVHPPKHRRPEAAAG